MTKTAPRIIVSNLINVSGACPIFSEIITAQDIKIDVR